MKEFYGTKRIKAFAMNRLDYNKYRGWQLPDDENGADEGYLVEYLDGGKPNHPDHEGYVSWSPKEQFENAYQQSGSMSFGHALEALKAGMKVARAGWNGKGMWVALTPGYAFPAAAAKPGHAAKFRADEVKGQPAAEVTLLSHIDMRTADGSMCIGWLASQTDMLAEDWMIVE